MNEEWQCVNCKYWSEYKDDLGSAICNATPFYGDIDEFTKDGKRVLKYEYKNTTAFVCDASWYNARLYTLANHGCKMWRGKGEPT